MLPPSKLWTKYRRSRQRHPLHRQPLAWVLALALTLSGGAMYLLIPRDWTWWVALAMTAPLVLLVTERGRRFERQSGGGFSDGGPWTPP